MPSTSKKMAVSLRGQADRRNINENDSANRSVDREDVTRSKRKKTGLQKTEVAASVKRNAMSKNPSFQTMREKSTKNVKEDPLESTSDKTLSNDRERADELSISSCTRYSSKLLPICSSPSRIAESSRTNLFSPQPPSAKASHHRAEYDQLDLDDTMMGEAPFQFEESPQRELSRSSPEGEAAQEDENSSRKRGSSRSDFPHPAKRSQIIYPHNSHYLHLPDDNLGNSSSMPRTTNSPYYNFYGNPYPATTYTGENRTPSRGTHQQGMYYSGYSPYHDLCLERSQRDMRTFPISSSSHAPYESDEESPPSPPPSPGARVSSITAPASTPEKVLKSMDANSPFRSPLRDSNWIGSESKSTIGFRPSPFFQRSPGISGSFDMGTPNGILADDDNLGPIFQAFEDTSTPLRILDNGTLTSIGMSLSHGAPEDTPSPSGLGRDRQRLRSPLTRHMSDLSAIDQPNLHQNTRPSPNFDPQAPTVGGSHFSGHDDNFAGESSSGGRKYLKANAVTVSDTRVGAPSSRLDSGAQPKQLWPSSSDVTPKERTSSMRGTQGPVSLEIGVTGSLTTRKTFEGINTMMQPRSSTKESKVSVERKNKSAGYVTSINGPQPLAKHHRRPHHPYSMGDNPTPRKAYNQMRSGHIRHQYPYPPLVGSARKSMYPPKIDSHYSMRGTHKPLYLSQHHSREGNSISQHHRSIPPTEGKENTKKKSVPKRSTCNCKKSRCLKLYCECFAAERFCQGCNCIDCGNTPESGEIREKAIKETRAKNSKAFQNRFSFDNSKDNKSAQKVHNMGCKCKKSACLKKYCECFNAGALCGVKCKCTDCLNYAGSQALIDKRRKIKDRPGAEYALRISDEQWKTGCVSSGRKAPAHRRHPMPSPVMMPPHNTMYPSPRGHPSHRSHGYSRLPPQRQYYMGLPSQMITHIHPHTNYTPLNIPVTPGYHRQTHRMTSGERLPHSVYRLPHNNRLSSVGRHAYNSTIKDNPKSTTGSPKTPGVRKAFDPATSRKKRKTSDGESEPTKPYFGEKGKQPKTTALAVFSFLSNDDLYHASLVCRRWGELAFDDELWKF